MEVKGATPKERAESVRHTAPIYAAELYNSCLGLPYSDFPKELPSRVNVICGDCAPVVGATVPELSILGMQAEYACDPVHQLNNP